MKSKTAKAADEALLKLELEVRRFKKSATEILDDFKKVIRKHYPDKPKTK